MRHLSTREIQRSWLPRAAPWLLVGILLTSFALRTYRVGDQSVWWDEGLAAWAARQSLSEIAEWTSSDVHPPLYFWILHYWRLLAGETEFGLRVLSVAVGVLTVAAWDIYPKSCTSRYCVKLTSSGKCEIIGIARRRQIWQSDTQRN